MAAIESKQNRSKQAAARERGWRRALIGAALFLWAGWAAALLWLGAGKQMPLDWDGLWDAGGRPKLRPTLLGVQDLRWGGSIQEEAGDPAFSLGGGRAVHLGRWVLPSIGPGASFGAWVKLDGNLPQSNLVALAGIAPPNEWGFGAWQGRPAAWMTELTAKGHASFRIVADQAWPTGRWVHLMVVGERSRCSLWVDGRRVAEKQADFIDPDGPDVWLGSVRRTASRFSATSFPLPKSFGLPAPEFLMDDFVVYSRELSEPEAQSLARAGRGGLLLARQRLELRARLAPGITAWVGLAGLLLLGLAFSKVLRDRLDRASASLVNPAFASAWVILLLGGGLTTWISLRLAKAAAEADRERMDLFCDRLVEAADTHFERVADVLRRARDMARLNPEITLAEWSRWAGENGFPYDFPALDGIGWAQRVEAKDLETVLGRIQERSGRNLTRDWEPAAGENGWQLPVTAYRSGGLNKSAHPYALVGWNWLPTLDQTHPGGPRAQLLSRPDTSTTGLVPLRPVPSEPAEIRGVQLYLPVYKSAWPPSRRRNRELLGVVFAGVRLAEMVRGYWHGKPPLFGARFITGTANSREAVAVDTGELFPETRRPAKPYVEKEVAIRTYGRRLWVQIWTTPTFHAHSQRYWPWVSAGVGGGFTVLAAGLVGMQARARLREKAAATKLRQAFENLEGAQRERQAISRDIHDGAIQSLYALQLQLERIGETSKESESDSAQQVSREISSTRAGLDAVIGELRQFTTFENPELPRQERMGLCGVLSSFIERSQPATTARLELVCDEAASGALQGTQAVQLANIAREALSNALRHASAGCVRLTLKLIDGNIRLEIADDGAGFDPENPARRGVGLDNMRTRAEEVGGSFVLDSKPGGGTRVSISIPIAPEKSAQIQRAHE